MENDAREVYWKKIWDYHKDGHSTRDCEKEFGEDQATCQRRFNCFKQYRSFLTRKELEELNYKGWTLSYIYLITNTLNGHTYIGQRKLFKGQATSIETDKYMGSGKLLHKAFEKYGIENFEKSILIQGSMTKEERDDAEKYFIWLAKNSGKAEYNLTAGGSGGDTSKWIDYQRVSKTCKKVLKYLYTSPEYKQHHHDGMIKAWKEGKFKTSGTKGMRFKHRPGLKRPGAQGQKMSEETKRKIREALSKFWDS
jgi:group I intron endonuclease